MYTLSTNLVYFLIYFNVSQSVNYLFVSCNNYSNYTISVFYSNTRINDLRSHCHYHINENSRHEEGAADNSKYKMMQ